MGLRVQGGQLKEELKRMDKHRGKTGNEVFLANTFEEARHIELTHAKRTAECIVLRAFIWVWLICANSILRILQLMFFGSHFDDQSKVDNIIVYTVGTLGDNVLLLPAIKSIKDKYGNAQLTVITNCNGFSSAPSEEIFGKVPYVDKVLTIRDHPVQRKGLQIRLEPVELKSNSCDLFVNLSPFGNRGWIGAVVREMIFAKKLKTKWAVGFRMSTYTRRNMFNEVQHYFVNNEANRMRDLLNKIRLKPVENEDLLPASISTREIVERRISDYRRHSNSLVIINPGAKARASQWPAERFGKIAARLVEAYHACVLVNGTESEKKICDEVVESSGGLAISLAGELPIRELIELLRVSSLVVTNNTGPMTLAAMTKTPMVVIASTRFSPTFYMPFSEKMVWLFCFSDNSYSYDDEDETLDDLRNIQTEHVMQAINRLKPFKNHYHSKAGQ